MEVEIHISFLWSIFVLDWNPSVFLCCHCKDLCMFYFHAVIPFVNFK